MKTTKLFFQTIIGLTLMVASNVQAGTMTFDEDFIRNPANIDYLRDASYQGMRFYLRYRERPIYTKIRYYAGKGANNQWRPGIGEGDEKYDNRYLALQGDAWSQTPSGTAPRWLTLKREDNRAFSFKGGHFANWNPNASHGPNAQIFNSTWLLMRAYYKNGGLAGEKRVTLGDWQWVDFAYDNLHRIEFRTDSWYWSMDNLRVVGPDETAEVPIPAAALLFAPALLGFMGLRRKAKASA